MIFPFLAQIPIPVPPPATDNLPESPPAVEIPFLPATVQPFPPAASTNWTIYTTRLLAPFPYISILQPQEVRPLPGSLDKIPVFHSNNPEVIQNEGILLSTFPSIGKKDGYAHLGFPFAGRFDLFAHHIAKVPETEGRRNLYLGIILHNPGKQAVTVDILAGGAYLTDPDALFVELPAQVEDPNGKVYAGPGSRVAVDILRNRRQENLPAKIEIPPQQSRMLLNQQIPLRPGATINGSSTYLKLQSSGKIYAASLALFGRLDETGQERAPTLQEWEQLVQQGSLVTPRDRIPTFTFDQPTGRHIYSRVAGVAQGSQWLAQLTDPHQSQTLTIPQPGQGISYPLSTLERGTLGTKQVQSAPMLVRYPDTAVRSQGNYGVQYSLTLPLYNSTSRPQKVAIALQTPLKGEEIDKGLQFLEPPAKNVFFRGPVKVSYTDERGITQTRYFHLVQRRGQQGEPLVILTLPPQVKRTVTVDLFYPADSTPPQVLTVTTLN